MAVTICYKGAPIASISTNASKTLKTCGKYCEDDITVNNIESGGGNIDGLIDGSITSISSNVTSVRTNACNGTTSLVLVSLPETTAIGANAFQGCSSLTSFSAPKLETMAHQVFYNADLTGTVILPALTDMRYRAFYGNSKLLAADFGSSLLTPAHTIEYGTFENCQNLAAIILRYSNAVALSNTNAFSNTKIANDLSARIYVPQSLVSTYQQAANWSALYAANSDIFQPIEGSEYE